MEGSESNQSSTLRSKGRIGAIKWLKCDIFMTGVMFSFISYVHLIKAKVTFRRSQLCLQCIAHKVARRGIESRGNRGDRKQHSIQGRPDRPGQACLHSCVLLCQCWLSVYVCMCVCTASATTEAGLRHCSTYSTLVAAQ